MKQVYVLRHGPKDKFGNLTAEGKKFVEQSIGKFGKFDAIFSSEMQRAIQTAQLLTGKVPEVDSRANVIDISPEEEEILFEKAKNHKYGIAGLVFETPEYRKLAQQAGERLVSLLKEVLQALPENSRALVISHDSSIAAAERILKKLPLDKIDHNYKPLEGFMVNYNMEVKEITS